MFFQPRSTQVESFDSRERTPMEVADGFRQLARANRVFFFSHPFVRTLPKLLGAERCRQLTLLDIGAGDGSLGQALTRWARNRGWRWEVTNLDANPLALQLNPTGPNVVGSALSLPFPANHFDIVIASQMTHHLATNEEVTTHFREALRVAREGVVLSDLHRNGFLFGMVWFWTILLRFDSEMRKDGLLSVRRGFCLKEWQSCAHAANIPSARVWLYFGTRIMLEARKPVQRLP